MCEDKKVNYERVRRDTNCRNIEIDNRHRAGEPLEALATEYDLRLIVVHAICYRVKH